MNKLHEATLVNRLATLAHLIMDGLKPPWETWSISSESNEEASKFTMIISLGNRQKFLITIQEHKS